MFDGRFRTGVDRVVRPLGNGLARTGASPDHLTALGLVLSVPAALAIGTGRIGLGLALLILSAVPDLLDGALAKAANRSTVRGAFFDSVCDRVTDSLVLGGLAWYLGSRRGAHEAMLPVAVLGVSLLISYLRAKAESLGFDAKGGIMERAERIIVLCVGLAFGVLLIPLLWVMLALTLVTAVQRFVKVWRQATAAEGLARTRTVRATGLRAARATATGPDGFPPVAERWRAWRETNGWTPLANRSRAARGDGAAERWRERRRRRGEVAGDRRRGTRRP